MRVFVMRIELAIESFVAVGGLYDRHGLFAALTRTGLREFGERCIFCVACTVLRALLRLIACHLDSASNSERRVCHHEIVRPEIVTMLVELVVHHR